MPVKKLTEFTVSSAKAPAAGRLELWDTILQGFGLRITDKDARSWFVMYRIDTPEGRKQRRMTLGNAKIISLAKAREDAREALQLVERGIDPVGVKAAPPLAVVAPITFGEVADQYLKKYVKRNTRPSTYKETKRILDVDVLPKWKDKPVVEIRRRDVDELLDTIADRGADVQANRTLARLKTLFNWAEEKEFVTASPVLRMKARTKERGRERALTDQEIKWFWKSCDNLGQPFGPLFKLLLLTAQRRDEVATMEWKDVDLEKSAWTIPRHKAKNDRAHGVALSDVAVKIIGTQPKIVAANSEGEEITVQQHFIFTTNGITPVSGFSRAKERLDKSMNSLRQKELKLKEGESGIEEFILHDLRRTAATGMAKLNIPPHVVDKILNHVSGTIRGVAAVYNRHAYTDERSAALETWSNYIMALVEGAPSNIEAMRE